MKGQDLRSRRRSCTAGTHCFFFYFIFSFFFFSVQEELLILFPNLFLCKSYSFYLLIYDFVFVSTAKNFTSYHMIYFYFFICYARMILRSIFYRFIRLFLSRCLCMYSTQDFGKVCRVPTVQAPPVAGDDPRTSRQYARPHQAAPGGYIKAPVEKGIVRVRRCKLLSARVFV